MAAVSAAEKAFAASERLYNELSFLLEAGSFSAAVTAGKFLDPARGIDKLLFAGEKWMTSGANADLNITTRRAGVIDRAARADDIGLVIFWMNARFHIQKRARNLRGLRRSRKR